MKKLILGLVALMLFAAACGSDSDDAAVSGEEPATTEAPAATDAPATTEAPATTAAPTTSEATAEPNIISMSPTATEILFAIGAGDQVLAVDNLSDFPPEAPVTDLSAFEMNIEAIAALEPETVVISWDAGGIVDGFEALGINTVLHPFAATLDDTYAQIADLGVLTGKVDEAAALVDDIRTTLDDFTIPADEVSGLTYYHELDQTYFSSTSSTFIGEVYNRLGMVNIADAVDDGSGFPQLTEEYILEADPDFIFLADTKCCGQSAQTIAERPGWADLTAVQNGTVIELDDDIASRWGPRVTDYMAVVAEAVANSLIPA